VTDSPGGNLHRLCGNGTRRPSQLRLQEQIFYGEFDGKRRKRAPIKIIGE
jgi:hypothetical protein